MPEFPLVTAVLSVRYHFKPTVIRYFAICTCKYPPKHDYKLQVKMNSCFVQPIAGIRASPC